MKIIYFVATSGRRWGKGLTLITAMQAAGLTSLKPYKKGGVEAVVYFAIFKKETTDEELENLRQCITADEMWGNPKFYENENEPTYKEDMKMIKELFIGWGSDKSFMAIKKETV